MGWYEDYEEDYYDDYLDDYYDDGDFGNDAESNFGEENTMSAQVGTQFTTGNSTVRTLKTGTILEVVGNGTLEIVEVPVVDFNPGDRINTKYGASTVVRFTTHFGEVEGFDPETQLLYVADGSAVVRRANKGDVSSL